ncbi:uncharacterized protein PGTG_09017 [Puccinia graminis f. sp. tritici CRL 75-36-700-3]|uniref:Dcp1p-Dcp2p decapping enzyme complex alpha subunit n=1 Tax=Puccinia graminis f. sp. tritici (strain CRL 75-36-700-3 / race SCCL) TaxID=418459 RepID=E3KFI9_PUCGT|nr:uncharacterized protein PGTG_09017 [Puccinia graminis f. sp. tritici CRL 75-36-700-3]EFP83064.2 hypothetical protein PGTG_09017 [Puccinia graminis f. sp. tritici CRL 75-36-700-3]
MSTTAAPEVTPKTKFLQQPSIYKHDVEQLSADGSNFDKWKRGLTRVILLTLGHANFFNKAENYAKLTAQENTCLLFLIQITIHDELASLVDQYTKGTEAYDAVQTNFQGTVRFRQMELIDKLLELRISGPTTEPSQVPGLFNKVFEIFAGLHKVGAGLPTVVESLILQAISPTPTSMSRSQLFQNISLQLGSKKDVSARDIQTKDVIRYPFPGTRKRVPGAGAGVQFQWVKASGYPEQVLANTRGFERVQICMFIVTYKHIIIHNTILISICIPVTGDIISITANPLTGLLWEGLCFP